MSGQPFAPRRSLLLAASLAIALALVIGVMAAPAASPSAESAPSLSAAKLAASCSGQNNTYGTLTYSNTLQRDITISCAPSQARVTKVEVTVNLDHLQQGPEHPPRPLHLHLPADTRPLPRRVGPAGAQL